MSLSTFSFPTTILFGAGSIGRLPGEAAAKGMKRPLLVTDRPLLNTSAYRTVSALIPGAVTFSAVDPNPTEKNVTEGTAFYHASGCDGVIGLGQLSPRVL